MLDDELMALIRRTIAEAEAAGKDFLTQTEWAVRAVREARPEMGAPEALTAVKLARGQYAPGKG